MNRPDLIQSTSGAFHAVKRILFQPFDLKKWFILGFAAWLAQLLEGGGSQLSFNEDQNFGSASFEEQKDVYDAFVHWAQDHLGMIITVASVVLMMGVGIYIALVWVRSRGKFMFLDNVVHNRYLVTAPWYEFKEEGNSLCQWTLMFVLVFLGVFLILIGFSGWYVLGVIQGDVWTTGSIVSVIVVGLIVFVLAIVWAYISVLLESFVVPIMYRDRVTATVAWKKFLPLHRKAFWWFVLYALWMFLLRFGLAAVVMMLGLMTCCVGFIIMALPYLGTVILLPAYVFFRQLGPDYLRQFGEEYDALTVVVPEIPQP